MVHHNEAWIFFKSFFLPLFNGISVRSGTLIMCGVAKSDNKNDINIFDYAGTL